MSNVVKFLEKLGQDAQLRHATRAEIDEALIRAGIEPALRAAILGTDQRLLEKLLGAIPNVCCSVDAPFGDEPEKKKKEEEEKPAEKPVEKEKAQANALGRAA